MELIHVGLIITRHWEDRRHDFVQETFQQAALLTRLGRLRYAEAMEMFPWERNHYLDAVLKMVAEERKVNPFGGDL